MLLTLKKLVARLFFPVPFIFLLLAAGLALLLWPRLGRRCRLAGKILLCAGTALFLLLSVFGGGLLKTLTSQYLPLDPETVPAEACTVVVAGSGFGMAESVPPELWFNDGMLLRLHEAGRIARRSPAAASTAPSPCRWSTRRTIQSRSAGRLKRFWRFTACRRNGSA